MKAKTPVFWNESSTYVLGILNYLLSSFSKNSISKLSYIQNNLKLIILR